MNAKIQAALQEMVRNITKESADSIDHWSVIYLHECLCIYYRADKMFISYEPLEKAKVKALTWLAQP